MRRSDRPAPGRTVWLLFAFMTLSLGFPLLFFYRYSTAGNDLLKSIRLRAGDFGRSVSRCFEDVPLDDGEVLSRVLRTIPLMGGAGIEIYNGEGVLIGAKDPDYPDYGANRTGLYGLYKKLFSPFGNGGDRESADQSGGIREELLHAAYGGRSGADYLFESGDIGDRILFFSYPIWEYSPGERRVKGVLLMEYRDDAASSLLKKQRSQFAAACLVFALLLFLYVAYVLTRIILPLRSIVRRVQAMERGTDYLLPAERIRRKDELGQLTLNLDGIGGLLESRDREMEQYLSEIRHILRNPLSNIKVALEGLMMGKASEKDLSFSGIIQNNLRRIDRYISVYNPVSEKLATGAGPESISIDGFLEATVQNYTYLAEKRGIELRLRKAEVPLYWKGFPTPLHYVCEQIINNAIDFSPGGSPITIESFQDCRGIGIRISDRGPGIPPGREGEIFKPYTSFRPKGGGDHTGTGLSLSSSILRKIGGTIDGRNGRGGGAVFTIILPVTA